MAIFELGKAIGVQMIEVLDKESIPDHKRGQTLKYNKQSIDHLDIWAHLTDDKLSLTANGAVDIAGELSAEDEFDFDKFERFYMAWKEGNTESFVK